MPKWELSRIKRLKLDKSIKEDRTVTYQEIADFVGISIPQMERYANGRVDSPNLEVMDKIARFFGTNWTYFIVEDDNGGNQMRPQNIPEGVSFGALSSLGGL